MKYITTTLKIVIAVLLLVLLTACNSGGGSAASGMQINVSGDIQATMNPDWTQATLEDDGSGGKLLQLYFNEKATRLVFFLLPPDTQPGEYQVGDTGISGMYMDKTGSGNDIFGGTSGTLTLEKAGDSYTGKFEFTAEEVALNGEDGRSVTVSGSFSDIKLKS